MPPDRVLEPLFVSATAYALVFALGALFGSFANVCIYRWPPTDEHPRGRSVVTPGSHCPACGRPVRWFDNVPVLSYLWLRGRCRDCGVSFSPRYLLVELAMAVVFVALYRFAVVEAFAHEPLSTRTLRFVALAGFAFTMIVIAFIDLDHMLILDKVTYPAIPIFYAAGTLLPGRGFTAGIVGAVVGYGVVRLIADGYYYATGREGMGYGDGKLLAIVGAFMGWRAVVASLFVGSFVGSVVSIAVLSVTRRGRGAGESGGAASSDVAGVGGEEESADEEAGEGAGAGGYEGASASQPDAAERDTDAHAGDDAGTDGEPAIRHVEVPFGPFLALGALVYVFLEPWLRLRLVGW